MNILELMFSHSPSFNQQLPTTSKRNQTESACKKPTHNHLPSASHSEGCFIFDAKIPIICLNCLLKGYNANNEGACWMKYAFFHSTYPGIKLLVRDFYYNNELLILMIYDSLFVGGIFTWTFILVSTNFIWLIREERNSKFQTIDV